MSIPFNAIKHSGFRSRYVIYGPSGYWGAQKKTPTRGPVYWTATHRDTGATVGPFRTLRELADKIAKEI